MKITKLCGTAYPVLGITTPMGNNDNIYFTCHDENIYHLHKNNKEPKILVNIKGAQLRGIVYSNNILYICDFLNHKILSYSIDTGQISTFAGNGEYGHRDGNINDAQFCYPRGITIDKNGDIYITDLNRIRKINLSSRIVETIAGSTTEYGYGGHKDGETKNALFNFPHGLIIDNNDDTIYVADSWNHCIRRIKNGIVSTIAGILDKEGNEDGPINQAMFEFPRGLILNDEGNLLVGDWNGLRIVNMNEKIVSTLQGISKEPISSLTKDNLGSIYIGCYRSIFLLENTWKYKRFLWIGHLKEASYCLLYALPKDMIREIASYI